MGKVLYKVTLTEDERIDLISLTKKGKQSARKVIHALILLNADEGSFAELPKKTNKSIAEHLKIGESMVERVKKRFVEDSITAALDDKPSEREYKCKIDGDLEAQLIALSCGEPPAGHSRWSLRLLADKVVELEYIDCISHETIRRCLQKNELKPWKKKSWVIPPLQNGDFVASMEKVLEVYTRTLYVVQVNALTTKGTRLFVWTNRQSNLSENLKSQLNLSPEVRKNMIMNTFAMEYVIFLLVLRTKYEYEQRTFGRKTACESYRKKDQTRLG